MLPIGEDLQSDPSLLDPERHAPLSAHAKKVRDAYTERKRARAALARADEDLVREVRAYAAERLLLFVRLLQERRLACCLHCEAVVPQEEADWLFVQHVRVTDEGYDCGIQEMFMRRACAACRREPSSGESVPWEWVVPNEIRVSRRQARKKEDGRFEIRQRSPDAGGQPQLVWAPLDLGNSIPNFAKTEEVPRRVPNVLPADLESALPPQIDLQPAGKGHFGFDPAYAGMKEGDLLLVTKDRQEKL